MRYLLLIYGDEVANAKATPEENAAVFQGHDAFAAFAGERMLGGAALADTLTATTVRLRDGQPLLTDGPFAETKEQLGGYYLVQCADLDEAIALAAKIPMPNDGCIEVRPIMEFE